MRTMWRAVAAFAHLTGCRAVEKQPSFGIVDVTIWTEEDTDSARLFVGGHFVGHGEAEIRLPVGKHQLRVEMNGYPAYEASILVLASFEEEQCSFDHGHPKWSSQGVNVVLERQTGSGE